MNPLPRRQREDHPGFKASAIDWLFAQGASTVLLSMILVAIGWGTHFAMTKAIPAHLETIQEGYAEIERSHSQQQQLTREANKENLRQVLDFAERRDRDRDRDFQPKASP